MNIGLNNEETGVNRCISEKTTVQAEIYTEVSGTTCHKLSRTSGGTKA